MRYRASDRTRALIRGARRGAGAALFLFLFVLAVGCEHPTSPKPPTTASVERPVTKLETRGAPAHILVPTAALTERGGITGVFVLQSAPSFPPSTRAAGGEPLPQARFRMVKTGKTAGNRVEILSGLTGDEVLVLGDLAGVRDGSPIAAKR